jgi:hypothetical protein
MKKLLLLLGAYTFQINVTAQKIEANLKLEQDVEINIPGRPLMRNKVVFYIKENKAKSESNQQGATLSIYYFDSTKEMITSVAMMEQKQKMIAPNSISEANKKYVSIEVKYVDEAKEIAGITCKKAILNFQNKAGNEERIVWYAPQILLPFKYNFGATGLELIKGLPMEYENTQNGFKMRHVVTKLDLTTVILNNTFIIPD